MTLKQHIHTRKHKHISAHAYRKYRHPVFHGMRRNYSIIQLRKKTVSVHTSFALYLNLHKRKAAAKSIATN